MVVDGLPAGVDEVYKWAHTDIEDNDPIDLARYLEDEKPGYEQTELDDFAADDEYRGDPEPRVVNTQFMGRRNYAREPGRTTDFEW